MKDRCGLMREWGTGVQGEAGWCETQKWNLVGGWRMPKSEKFQVLEDERAGGETGQMSPWSMMNLYMYDAVLIPFKYPLDHLKLKEQYSAEIPHNIRKHSEFLTHSVFFSRHNKERKELSEQKWFNIDGYIWNVLHCLIITGYQCGVSCSIKPDVKGETKLHGNYDKCYYQWVNDVPYGFNISCHITLFDPLWFSDHVSGAVVASVM